MPYSGLLTNRKAGNFSAGSQHTDDREFGVRATLAQFLRAINS